MGEVIEGEITSSPVVKTVNKPITMDFPDAIRELTKGKYITRIEWDNSDYGLLKDGLLMLYRNDILHKWTVNDGDLLAEDWIVINEAN